MTLDEIKKMTKEEFLQYINNLYSDKKLYNNKLINKVEYNITIGILAGFSTIGMLALLYCDYIFVSSVINGLIDEGFTDINIAAASVATGLNVTIILSFAHLYKKYKKENFSTEKFNKIIYSLHDELCKLDEKKLSIIKDKLNFDILNNMNEENINKSDVLKIAKTMQNAGLEDLLVRFENQSKITKDTLYASTEKDPKQLVKKPKKNKD